LVCVLENRQACRKPLYQRMIVASIDKFYRLVVGVELNLKHLYPLRKTHTLPKYLSLNEVKKMVDLTTNQKSKAPRILCN